MDHSRFVAYRGIPPDVVPIAATTAAKPWATGSLGFPLLGLVLAKRAGERSRTADVLIPSERSVVADRCKWREASEGTSRRVEKAGRVLYRPYLASNSLSIPFR